MRGGALFKEFGGMNAAEIFDYLGWERPEPPPENTSSNAEATTPATRLLNEKKRKLTDDSNP